MVDASRPALHACRVSAEDAQLSAAEEAWLEHDLALRRRARRLAERYHRDEQSLYRTLKNFERSPAERLRLGLWHARLHPERR